MRDQMVVGSSALVGADEEQKLEGQVSLVERKAAELVISDEISFRVAGELTRQVKQVQKSVTEYWEPMRKSTYEAYKTVTDHKKEMLDPLERAEKTLKRKISEWSREQEHLRREEEERQRRLAMEEMERKLAEAEAAEAAGDSEAAEYAMAEAEVYEGVADVAPASVSTPKVEGISMRKNWRIINIDPTAVPNEFAGVVLRPVDEKAVLRLIKASKGQIRIPGVKYEEFSDVSVRT